MHNQSGILLESLSDVGCQRQNNEDYYGSWQSSSADEFARKGLLVVVADGMGGYEGGQEASRIAVETLQRIYSQPSATAPQTLLTRGLIEAHSRIKQYAIEHPALLGMGTTCTAAAVVGKSLYYGHVGDSRLYLIRNGEISRLTRDHSYVGRLVESGAISPEEAEIHAQRHILTAALGAGDEIIPDVPDQAIQLQENDILVLCSDGLWGQVSDPEIAKIASSASPAQACRELVQLARARGGPDNITVQVLAFATSEAE